MAFGAVFTSSAGGDIGGGRLYTRLRGPILAGYASTADPGGQTQQSTANIAGSAAQPMYSFYVRPDSGYYAANVTTSVGELRWSHLGVDLLSFMSSRVAMISTAAAGSLPGFVWSNGFLASSANQGCIYLPQTTYTVSSSSGTSDGTTPPAAGSGVAMLFDSVRNKISVFSTVANQWLSVTLTSS